MRRVAELSSSAWLALWEQGHGQSSAQRALTCLRVARLREDDDPAAWSIAERDVQLLLLRESAFGQQLEGSADCPKCGERLELHFSTREIMPRNLSSGKSIAIEHQGYVVQFRFPAAGDLAALPAAGSSEARDELLGACFLNGRFVGEPVGFAEIPEEVRDAVEREMAQQDPDAITELALHCPSCAQAWKQAFDAASFLWTELDAWARRTLSDVHTLASAYGWTESEILRLSATRRQLYLGLIRP